MSVLAVSALPDSENEGSEEKTLSYITCKPISVKNHLFVRSQIPI